MNADYLAWLEERDWGELEPGTLVKYNGSILSEREATWRVVLQVADDRYTIANMQSEWHRLNANRVDLTPVPMEGKP